MITDYEFQPQKGISGILTPNGIFLKCGNAQHYMILELVDPEEYNNCLFFSSRLIGEDDGVVSFSPLNKIVLTVQQEHWISLNMQYFDQGQIKKYNLVFAS